MVLNKEVKEKGFRTVVVLPLELNERAAEAAKLNDAGGREGMHSVGFDNTLSQKSIR